MIFNMVAGIEPTQLVRTAGTNTTGYHVEISGSFLTLYRTITFSTPGVYYVIANGAYQNINDPSNMAIPESMMITVSNSETNVSWEYFMDDGVYYTMCRVAVVTSGTLKLKALVYKTGSLTVGYQLNCNVYGPAAVTITNS